MVRLWAGLGRAREAPRVGAVWDKGEMLRMFEFLSSAQSGFSARARAADRTQVRSIVATTLAGAVSGFFLAAVPVFAHADDIPGAIERIEAGDNMLRLGYRTDTAPFSSSVDGKPVGYTVDICKAVGDAVVRLFPDRPIRLVFVPVAAEERFDALKGGEIDLLCGATTVTIDRRRRMDFSLLTFVTGGALLVRKTEDVFGGVASTIGVLGGTTSESALNRILSFSGDAAEIHTVDSHDDGVAKLKAGELNGYFSDRALLDQMMASNPGEFSISEEVLTFEPYALAIRRGDDALRLTADETIARLYRDGGILNIHRTHFDGAQPTPELMSIYRLLALPDDG